jgi:hypothetical protein
LQSTLSGQVEKFSTSEAKNSLRAIGREGSSTGLEQSRAGLSDREAKLAAANAALTKTKNELRQVDAARVGAEHAAIEQNVEHIPRDDSFANRNKTLFEVLHEDWTAAVPAAVLDIVWWAWILLSSH